MAIPRFVTDPTWSLQPWPVVLDVGGHTLTIPALPAAAWLAVLMDPGFGLDDVIPGMLADNDAELLEQAILDEQVDLDELYDACLDVIEAASGRAWYVALRLILVAREGWNSLGGDVILHGVDASRLSLAGWLDAVFLLMLRSMKPESITMFLSRLELPPPQEQGAAADIEIPRDAFMELMN